MLLAWLRRLIGAAVLCGVPGSAHAGAWVLTEEQTILTVGVGETQTGELYEGSLYSESPLGDHFSVIATNWMTSEADAYGGRGLRSEAGLALKVRLDDQGRLVSALQGGVISRNDLSLCPETGAEVRYLTGLSVSRGAFFNAEAAWRAFGGACSDARLDLTAGYRPNENWLTLGEMFADFPAGDAATIKLQVSAVRFVAKDWGIQFGLRRPVAGDAVPLMLILGVWY